LIPVLRDLSVALTDWWEVNGALVRQRFDRFLSSIGRFAEIAVGPLGQLFAVFGAVGLALNIKRIGVALGGFAKSIPLLGPALEKLGPMIPTLARFGGALALIALAAEDVIVFSRGGDSLIGRVLRALGGEGAEKEGRETLNSMTDMLSEFGDAVSALGGAAMEETGRGLKSLADGLRAAAALNPTQMSVLNSIADTLENLSIKAIGFTSLADALKALGDGFRGAADGWRALAGALQGTEEQRAFGLRTLGAAVLLGDTARPPGYAAGAAEFRGRPVGTGDRLSVSVPVTINGSPLLDAAAIQEVQRQVGSALESASEGNQ